jgi:hypothetical protein
MMIGNGLHATVWCWHGRCTLGKIVQLKNVQNNPSIKKSLVSGSQLMKDGLKLVFNKAVLSKYSGVGALL